MNDAWNHCLLTISFFVAWTVALAYIGGHRILWQYESFPEDEKNK